MSTPWDLTFGGGYRRERPRVLTMPSMRADRPKRPAHARGLGGIRPSAPSAFKRRRRVRQWDVPGWR
jgi:hypothetical protein